MLLPLGLHFALIVGLYSLLTLLRLRAVGSGERSFGDFAKAEGDTPPAARIARNVANQFELASFAWWAALFLIVTRQATMIDVTLAWLFLAGRVIHTWVQTTGDNVRLRGQVYVVTFLAVVGLMLHVAWIGWQAL